MAEVEKKKKRFNCRRLIIVIGAAVAALAIAFFAVEHWLKGKILDTVKAGLKGEYLVEVGSVNVSLASRSVSFENVRVRSDSALQQNHDTALSYIEIKLASLRVGGIGFDKDSARLTVKKVELVSPDIYLVRHPKTENHTIGKGKVPGVPVDRRVKIIDIERLTLSNGQARYDELSPRDSAGYLARNFNIDAFGFLLGPEDVESQRAFYCKNIVSTFQKITCSFNRGAFVLDADSVAFGTGEKYLRLGALTLTPQYSRYDFVYKAAGNPDWTEFSFGPIDFTGVDYVSILPKKTVIADSVSISRGVIASYKNKKAWQPTKNKPLFQDLMRSMPFKVDIPVLAFKELDVTYRELAPDGNKAGTVTFKKMHGAFEDLTNADTTGTKTVKLHAQCLFMGVAPLTATFHLPAGRSDNYFSVEGTLGAMDATALNPVIEPLMHAAVSSGKINSLHFSISGGATNSQVNCKLLYNNLSVTLLRKDNGKKRGFLTFVLDEVVLRNDNPDRRGYVQLGHGENRRDPHRSMFNYLWKSLLPGITNSVVRR